MTRARVLSVNAGRVAPLPVPGRGAGAGVDSAIVKTPLSTLDDPRPVGVGRLGIAGDEQADGAVHGGAAKAVYLYPFEHYAFWRTLRRQAGVAGPDDVLPCGWLGENLTVEGLAEADLWIGDLLRVGDVELRIESTRRPCYKFDARMGFDWASKMMVQSAWTGFYCSVQREGALAAGAGITVVAGDRVLGLVESHRLRYRSSGKAPARRPPSVVE